ncbi:hypothetical protein ACSFBF_22775 [Variovorax sp. ZT5P49]
MNLCRPEVGSWDLSLNHKAFIGEATPEGTLASKRGTGTKDA